MLWSILCPEFTKLDGLLIMSASTTHDILPGDTLKCITQEHQYMDEFVDWMKRR
jgi:hypothetical protein